MKPFKLNILAIIIVLFAFIACTKSEKKEVKHKRGVNSEAHLEKPYLVLISIDGYRWDYTEKYKPKNIMKIAKEGTRAKSLEPVFPSMTFPNHFSIITGRYADHHELVSNGFYDPAIDESFALYSKKANREGKWFRGEPVWEAAENAGMVSATMFWVGSEAPQENNVLAAHYEKYNGRMEHAKRVEKILGWLKLPKDKRPHFITGYFSAVDSKGHKFGPDSPEVAAAIKDVDKAIGDLVKGIEMIGLPVNLIIVSDHGMGKLDPKKVIYFDEITEMTDEIQVEGRGAVVHVYSTSKEKDARWIHKILKENEKNYKAVLRENMPTELQYSKTRKVGDVVMMADYPYYIVTKRKKFKPEYLTKGATHGWDPKLKDMHGIFYASGPMFKKDFEIDSFKNVHIYPLMMHILGLTPKEKHDGDLSVLKPILSGEATQAAAN